jgi:hypothetical protein
MSYKGRFSGTLFLEYVKTLPHTKPEKINEFVDMKTRSKPSEDDIKRREYLSLKRE